MSDFEHDREPQRMDYVEGSELLDWLYIAVGVAVLVAIIAASIFGHHLISLGVQP